MELIKASKFNWDYNKQYFNRQCLSRRLLYAASHCQPWSQVSWRTSPIPTLKNFTLYSCIIFVFLCGSLFQRFFLIPGGEICFELGNALFYKQESVCGVYNNWNLTDEIIQLCEIQCNSICYLLA